MENGGWFLTNYISFTMLYIVCASFSGLWCVMVSKPRKYSQ